MNTDKVIIRFSQVAEQPAGPVLRFVGFVKAKEMLQLFDAADLEANPRSAKSGNVTEDILESITETPEIFAFKTKGVLVGASSYVRLQRNRLELSFINPKIEGVLDGGHNMLAIGTHILSKATGDMRVKRRIKRWPDFKDQWELYRKEVEHLRKSATNVDDEGPLDFLIPLEILVPSDLEDAEVVEQFNGSLLAICSARNNNVELTLETKANKKGYYEDLRQALPTGVAQRVEWKTNDGGDIKVRDLIALAWIPLSALDLPYTPELSPQNIYRNKGECAKMFDELMGLDAVSEPTDGEYTRALHNEQVRSAIILTGQLPELYDRIYRDFPYAYNDGGGKFGNINVVKMSKDMRTAPTTYFTGQPVDYSYPDGLIMPLVYGLKSLIEVDENGLVDWKQDPFNFLDTCLPNIVKKYRVILDAFRFDPQKVGKNEGSYELVLDAFETELLRQHQRKGRRPLRAA
jgi:hypothetical protein